MTTRRGDRMLRLQLVIIAGMVMVVAGFGYNLAQADQGWTGNALLTFRSWDIAAVSADGTPAAAYVLELKNVAGDHGVSAAAWYLGTVLPTAALLLVILLLLLRVVTRARRSDPFVPATVLDLRLIAVIALCTGVLATFADVIAVFVLTGDLAEIPLVRQFGGQPMADVTIPAVWVFGAFAVYACAEIIKRGCALRAELAGVI